MYTWRNIKQHFIRFVGIVLMDHLQKIYSFSYNPVGLETLKIVFVTNENNAESYSVIRHKR